MSFEPDPALSPVLLRDGRVGAPSRPKPLPSKTPISSATAPSCWCREGRDKAACHRPHQPIAVTHSSSSSHGAWNDAHSLPARTHSAKPRGSVKSSRSRQLAAGGEAEQPVLTALLLGSDAALSAALAPAAPITHLCTNTAHMAQPRREPGRGVGSRASGLGQVCQSRQPGRKGREALPKALPAASARRDGLRTPAGLEGKDTAEVGPVGCFPRLGAN